MSLQTGLARKRRTASLINNWEGVCVWGGGVLGLTATCVCVCVSLSGFSNRLCLRGQVSAVIRQLL